MSHRALVTRRPTRHELKTPPTLVDRDVPACPVDEALARDNAAIAAAGVAREKARHEERTRREKALDAANAASNERLKSVMDKAEEERRMSFRKTEIRDQEILRAKLREAEARDKEERDARAFDRRIRIIRKNIGETRA
jgi:hypothetical protein